MRHFIGTGRARHKCAVCWAGSAQGRGKDQDICPGCLPRAQVRFKRGVDVSGGAHAWEASATLGSLGSREMPGAGVNPVRHVPQSVPTGNASEGSWNPLPAPREAGMGRKTSDPRREMGDARDHTAGRVTKVQGASDHTAGGVTKASPLSGLASERTDPGLPSSWAVPSIGLVA
jgi:hypothetical protein